MNLMNQDNLQMNVNTLIQLVKLKKISIYSSIYVFTIFNTE